MAYVPVDKTAGQQVSSDEWDALSQAVAEAQGNSDSGVAALVNDTASETYAAIQSAAPAASDATVAPILEDTASDSHAAVESTIDAHLGGDSTGLVVDVAAITPGNGKRAVGKGELVIDAGDYLTPGSSTVQDNTELNAAITNAAVGGPVAVYFPRGSYLLQHPFPNASYVTYKADTVGAGSARVRITWSSGTSMLTPNATLYGLQFEGLCLDAGTDGGHLVDFDTLGTAGSPGGLAFSDFSRCWITTNSNPGASFLSGGLGSAPIQNFFDVHVDKCRIERSATASVPAVNLRSSIGGLNHVFFRGGWVHSHGATTPAIKIEGMSATQPIGDLIFDGLIGEQSNGGMLSIGGANGVRVHNVKDWDTTGSYSANLFDFYQPSGGAAPHGVWIEGSGTPQAASFGSGFYHLSIAGGVGHHVGRVVNGLVQPLVNVTSSVGRRIRHSGGMARSLRVVTGSTTVTEDDDVIVCKGSAALTVTLPALGQALNSGNIPVGRAWTVSNDASATGNVSVAAPGSATISGQDPYTLAPGDKITVIQNGANWFTI